MKVKYFHRSCNKTVRMFYEDFDLLPKEAKELLWYSDVSPNFEDLKSAWELAGEVFNLDNLLNLNVFAEEKKAFDLAEYRAEKERKKKEWQDRRYKNKYGRRLGKPEDNFVWKLKHYKQKEKMVRMLVSEKEALDMLAKRKETKEVKPSGPVWVKQYLAPREMKKIEPELKFMEFEPVQHICKMMHNAGGNGYKGKS